MARFRYDIENKKWIEIDGFIPDPNAGLNGPIYCPDGGYFDKALNRYFHTKEEKRFYMRENKLRMEGNDDNRDRNCPEAGMGKRYYSFGGQKIMSKGYKYR